VTRSEGTAATVSAGNRRAGGELPGSAGRTGGSADPSGKAQDVDVQRGPTFVLAALLLVAGVLIGLSPALGMVNTADGSATTTATVAAFVAVLPGLFALGLTGYRTLAGLAATAGAGLLGVVRLLTDLGILTAADSVSRPELFAETTDRARPFTVGAGAWLLVAADLLWLTVGVLAAVRLAATTQVRDLVAPSDAIFGGPSSPVPSQPPPTLDGSSAAVKRAGVEPIAGPPGTVVGQALGTDQQRAGRTLNLPMVGVGAVGAVLLMVSALGTPYSGGYLSLRVLPFGSSMSALVAAALLGFLTAIAVLVAGALPRAVAQAFLLGTALAAAVPSLTAVVAVVTGAPTSLSPVVWCGLLGALIIAAAGFLAGDRGVPVLAGDDDGAPPAHWLTVSTGAAAVLAGAALIGAANSALLYLDGAPPDDTVGAALSPAGPPLLVAGIPLALAGVLALLRPTAELGRAAVTVLWAGAMYGFGQALLASSLVLSTAGDETTTGHSWSTGPGQWLTLLGTGLALVAAVLAGVTARRVSQASLDVVDDDSLERACQSRRWPAVGLTVLIVVALSLPIYRSLAGSASTLVNGYDLDTWGLWALAIGSMGAVWAGALSRRAGVSATLLVAAAAVVGQPLLVPSVIRAVPGFELGIGFWVMTVAVVVLLPAAGYFGRVATQVHTSRPAPLGAAVEPAKNANRTGRVRSTTKGGRR
jgi:hypothetical protein